MNIWMPVLLFAAIAAAGLLAWAMRAKPAAIPDPVVDIPLWDKPGPPDVDLARDASASPLSEPAPFAYVDETVPAVQIPMPSPWATRSAPDGRDQRAI